GPVAPGRLRPPQTHGAGVGRLLRRARRAGPSAATIITSNRAVDEWVALFDDPIVANSALDRFAHRAHQIVMEGPSLRAARAPSRARAPRRPVKDSLSGGYPGMPRLVPVALRPSMALGPQRPLAQYTLRARKDLLISPLTR